MFSVVKSGNIDAFVKEHPDQIIREWTEVKEKLTQVAKGSSVDSLVTQKLKVDRDSTLPVLAQALMQYKLYPDVDEFVDTLVASFALANDRSQHSGGQNDLEDNLWLIPVYDEDKRIMDRRPSLLAFKKTVENSIHGIGRPDQSEIQKRSLIALGLIPSPNQSQKSTSSQSYSSYSSSFYSVFSQSKDAKQQHEVSLLEAARKDMFDKSKRHIGPRSHHQEESNEEDLSLTLETPASQLLNDLLHGTSSRSSSHSFNQGTPITSKTPYEMADFGSSQEERMLKERHIRVHSIFGTGVVFSILVKDENTTTILNLKEWIRDNRRISISVQELLRRDQILQDHMTVHACGIDGNVLLVLKPKAGAEAKDEDPKRHDKIAPAKSQVTQVTTSTKKKSTKVAKKLSKDTSTEKKVPKRAIKKPYKKAKKSEDRGDDSNDDSNDSNDDSNDGKSLSSTDEIPTPSSSSSLPNMWRKHGSVLIRGRVDGLAGSTKIAGFDMDSTLIRVASGKKFPIDEKDWMWAYSSVPSKVKALNEAGYRVVIFTNQNGIEKGKQNPTHIMKKIDKLIESFGESLERPILAMVATGKDKYRKPSPVLFQLFITEMNHGIEPSLVDSFYVGDAAGRKEDWSCTDRCFAFNTSLPFKTQDEFFLGRLHPNSSPWSYPEHSTIKSFKEQVQSISKPSNSLLSSIVGWISGPSSSGYDIPFPETLNNTPEMILMCGLPGSGKSTIFKTYFEPRGYIHINLDTLKSSDKCLKLAEENLKEGKSVVIDQTLMSIENRKPFISLAHRLSIKSIRLVHIDIPLPLAKHLNIIRNWLYEQPLVPDIAYNVMLKKFQTPSTSEGIHSVIRLPFKPNVSSSSDPSLVKAFLFHTEVDN